MQSAELVDVEMNIHSTELRQSGNFEHLVLDYGQFLPTRNRDPRMCLLVYSE